MSAQRGVSSPRVRQLRRCCRPTPSAAEALLVHLHLWTSIPNFNADLPSPCSCGSWRSIWSLACSYSDLFLRDSLRRCRILLYVVNVCVCSREPWLCLSPDVWSHWWDSLVMATSNTYHGGGVSSIIFHELHPHYSWAWLPSVDPFVGMMITSRAGLFVD